MDERLLTDLLARLERLERTALHYRKDEGGSPLLISKSVRLNPSLYVERAEPAAPAANQAVIFARDNGSGKTQLCAKFNTGAVQVIATEP